MGRVSKRLGLLRTSCCFLRELIWPQGATQFYHARRHSLESSSIQRKRVRCSPRIGRTSKWTTSSNSNVIETNHHEIRRHVRRRQRSLSQRGADCELGISGAHRGQI